MKGIRRAVVLAAVVALAATPVLAQNVLVNSSFEVSNPLGWITQDRSPGQFAVSTEKAHTGTYSMKLWNGTPNSIKQDAASAGLSTIALDPTKSYQRSVWVYLTSVPDPTKGVEVFFSTGLDSIYKTKSIYVFKANEWVQVVDPDLYTGYSKLGMFGVRVSSGTNPAYFDDAAFAVTPEPGSLAGLAMGATGLVGFAIRRRKNA